MASKTVQAAGGIVVRKGARGLIAVVQRSKDDAWVLPRGKLKRDENPIAAARREVIEETGHRVAVHEYVGAITYRAGGRPKVVQFWRMEADIEPSHELMSDISAVEWLPLKTAVRRLSYPLEKLFLRHAASRALKKRRADNTAAKPANKTKVKKTKAKKTKPKKSLLKSRPDKTKTKAAGKAARKLERKIDRKADRRSKEKSKDKAKNKSKDKSKGKSKNKDKGKGAAKDKAGKRAKPHAAPSITSAVKLARGSGKNAARKLGKPTASAAPIFEAGDGRNFAEAQQKLSSVTGAFASLPDRSGVPMKSDEPRTILQRMLGRLVG